MSKRGENRDANFLTLAVAARKRLDGARGHGREGQRPADWNMPVLWRAGLPSQVG